MPWYANPKTRHAFKVARATAAKVTLINAFGLEFVEPVDRLTACGYHTVARRPDYAEPGHYGLNDSGLFK